jgi:hypothetical protein
LNQSNAAALPLSTFSDEPPLNPLSASGHRLPPAEAITKTITPPPANNILAAPKRTKVTVVLCLTNGERVPVQSFDDEELAKESARAFTRELQSSEWQLVGARFVRPDAVVTVDLETSK